VLIIIRHIFFFSLLVLFVPSTFLSQSYFTENKGQWPDNVSFKTEFSGARVYLEKDGFTFDTYNLDQFNHWAHAHGAEHGHDASFIQAHAFKMQINNCSERLVVEAFGKSQGYENFFLGEKSKWASQAYNYKEVAYRNVYPFIDIEIQKSNEQFKYDWVLRKGADINDISFRYKGADKIQVKKGRLVIKTSVQDFEEYIPLAYYKKDGELVEVSVSYVKKGDAIGFQVKEGYPKEYDLYIDPILIFSTYSGSTANNFGYTATFDSKGFLYAGSTAFGTGYPALLGAYNMFQGGTIDVAITKYDTTGTFRVYSTYLGGNNNEMPHSMIVNSNDELFVYGTTGSANFPTLSNAFQSTNNLGSPPVLQSGLGFEFDQGQDIFISRFSADGLSLMASTFIGGSGSDGLNINPQLVNNYADEVRGEIEIDSNDNIFVATSTQSSDFPITADAFQNQLNGTQDGVMFKMDNNLTSLVWSSYFGGSGADAFYSMDINDSDEPIAAGGTTSGNLPFTNNAYQQSYSGNTDGFLVRFNSNGNDIEAMTYLGFENYDQIYFVEFDSDQNPFVFGQTQTGDLYNFNNLYSNPNSGQFLSHFTADLENYEWGMSFGNGNGEPNISPTAFLVDFCGKIYLSGWGGDTGDGDLTTSGLPFTPDAYQTQTDGRDFYLYVTGIDLTEPDYASFFGGNQSGEHVDGGTSRFDKKGKIYQAVCAGCGGFDDFPFFPSDAVSSENGSSCNIGVFKMDFEEPLVIADFNAEAVCFPDPVNFNDFSFNAENYQWFFGDNMASTEPNPSHIYSSPGLYEVMLVVNNSGSCNQSDTLIKQILVLSPDGFELEDITLCNGSNEQIGIPPFGDASITYSWIPSTGLSDPTAPNPFYTGTSNASYTLTINNGICSSQATQNISVVTLDLMASSDTVICSGGSASLNVNGQGIASNYVWSTNIDFGTVLSNDSNLVDSPILPTTYYIMADYLSCQAIDSVTVVPEEFSVSLSDDLFLCLNETGTLTATNLFPQYDIDYDWSPNEAIVSGDGTSSIEINPSADTEFFINLQNELGCIWQESIQVEVSDLDINAVNVSADNTVITTTGSTTLVGQPGSPFNVSWSPTSGLSNPFSSTTTASPNNTTTYVYSVIDDSPLGQCIGMDSITIIVEELVCGFPTVFLPNSFTPNGDGENDILFLRGDLIESMSLEIYDRWGEKVFESNDQSVGWDGTYKGREADSAVYVYVLEATCVDGQELSDNGNVTLIR